MNEVAHEVRLPPLDRRPHFPTRQERGLAIVQEARALDGRVFQHRLTRQVRAVSWSPTEVTFFVPENGAEFTRSHRKALQWCAEADDVTPREGEVT